MRLGLVATGRRNIKSGKEYEKYFTEKPLGQEVELMKAGTVYDTLKLMKKVVSQTLSQTLEIASALKGNSREATCRNIWNFLYHNIQYKKDSAVREQLRTPARSWKDRKSGIDCDCYSIFASSILTNLKIPHSFRMTGYKGDYQHVYVVVPKENGDGFYIIDPVTDRFNYEVPYVKKHDQMISMLNGVDDCANQKPEIQRLRKFMDTQQIIQLGRVPTLNFLLENKIAFVPTINKEDNRSGYAVCTPSGLLEVPTVLTKEQSDQVKSAALTPQPAAPSTDAATKKPFPWWWVAIGAGALILLTGGDQNEVQAGLSGLGKKASRKLKTIRI